jgi:hypothetical protein
MHLGDNRDANSGDPGHDEKDAGQSRDAGADAYPQLGRGSAPGLGPGHDDTEPGYAPPVPIPQSRRPSLHLPQAALLA